jgi:hypothetical protein
MASEVLAVPESCLKETIKVIRDGMKAQKRLSKETRQGLSAWCDSEEAYLKGLTDGD